MERIRSFETLTNEEIVGVVDLLAVYTTLHRPEKGILDGGIMHYRKIEAKMFDESDGIMIRITCSEFESEKEVLGIILEDGYDDVFIRPINRQTFIQEYIDKIGVTGDFAKIHQPLKKVYMYFAETLQMWNLGELELTVNENLKDDDWSVIDEQIAD
jgi:hypothetical protein